MQLQRINPSVKLIGLMVFSVLFLFTYSLRLNLAILVVCLCWLVVSRVPWKRFTVLYALLLLSAFGIFMSAALFGSTGTVAQEGMIHIDGYTEAWNLSTRIMVLGNIGMLFALTTSNRDLMESLRDQLHVPSVFVYGIFATFNLFPDMYAQAQRNAIAFLSRGKRASLFSIAVWIPLVIKTLYWTDALTLAMTSKRFTPEGKRTVYHRQVVGVRDYIFLVFLGCGALSFIWI